MKDRFFLLLASLVASALVWAYFYFFGKNALDVFFTLAFIACFADNIRLRRKLKENGIEEFSRKKN